MAAVTIHGFAQSTFVRTVQMACVEKGAAYELVPLDFKSAGHFAMHPFGKMPVADVCGKRLFETLAITTMIDETFDGAPLFPSEIDARVKTLQWASAASDYLYADVVNAFLSENGSLDEKLKQAMQTLKAFDAGLAGGDWFGSAALSAADLFVAPIIAFAHGNADATQCLSGLDGLANWYVRLCKRPSFRETAG